MLKDVKQKAKYQSTVCTACQEKSSSNQDIQDIIIKLFLCIKTEVYLHHFCPVCCNELCNVSPLIHFN